MERIKVRITWRGNDSTLDSIAVDATYDDMAVTQAIIEMLRGNVVRPGNVIVISEES